MSPLPGLLSFALKIPSTDVLGYVISPLSGALVLRNAGLISHKLQ